MLGAQMEMARCQTLNWKTNHYLRQQFENTPL